MNLIHPKKATLINSLILILIGLSGYFIKSSPTALIPVLFGILLGVCYLVYDKNNKLIAHIAIVLILIVLVSLFMPLNKRIADQDIFGTLRVLGMQLVSLYSMICFIASFIKARKES